MGGLIALKRGALVAPAMLCTGLLVFALSTLVVASVTVPGGPWYGHYWKFLSDDLYTAYLYRSTRVALCTTAVAVPIGYATAYVMTRASASTRRLIVIVLILQFF